MTRLPIEKGAKDLLRSSAPSEKFCFPLFCWSVAPAMAFDEQCCCSQFGRGTLLCKSHRQKLLPQPKLKKAKFASFWGSSGERVLNFKGRWTGGFLIGTPPPRFALFCPLCGIFQGFPFFCPFRVSWHSKRTCKEDRSSKKKPSAGSTKWDRPHCKQLQVRVLVRFCHPPLFFPLPFGVLSFAPLFCGIFSGSSLETDKGAKILGIGQSSLGRGQPRKIRFSKFPGPH